MTVAVLGAGGTMGLPMSANLARAGHEIRAWNRTAAKAEPLREEGAAICATPAEAARGAGVVLTMLSDADAVLDAMSGDAGALAGAAGDAVWLQASTIGLEGTERCAALAEQAGVVFVDAPVLGTRQPAERGALVVLASGPGEARERVAPIFDVLGSRTLWVGEAGAGTRLKLVANAWLLAIVEGLGETIALAEGLGVDPQLLLDAVSGGPLDLPYLQTKGRAIMERDFTPAFRLALAAKDAGLVGRAAERHDLDLPLLAAVATRMRDAAGEHGDEDISATYLASAPRGAA
jgi:3-hydroxyisobutyrate dehydrogenase